jgi:hypothetical protein
MNRRRKALVRKNQLSRWKHTGQLFWECPKCGALGVELFKITLDREELLQEDYEDELCTAEAEQLLAERERELRGENPASGTVTPET